MNGLPGMRGVKVYTGAAAAVLLMAYVGLTPALADTIEAALVKAYQNNPQLNAQRASVRSIDEAVPQALSGYRPRVSITSTVGEQFTDATAKTVGRAPVPGTNQTVPTVTYIGASATTTPWSYSATAQQTLFN